MEEKEQQVFALRILKTVNKESGAVNYEIKSQNAGLTDPEVIVFVEEWLKKVRDSFAERMFKGEKAPQ
jgi:quinol monooxygenase YgiN